ncbi:MAG: hypothetical protein JWR66_1812 [Modestobacter sp.]|nr:hypothetical protein [Modestobacter sp.]
MERRTQPRPSRTNGRGGPALSDKTASDLLFLCRADRMCTCDRSTPVIVGKSAVVRARAVRPAQKAVAFAAIPRCTDGDAVSVAVLVSRARAASSSCRRRRMRSELSSRWRSEDRRHGSAPCQPRGLEISRGHFDVGLIPPPMPESGDPIRPARFWPISRRPPSLPPSATPSAGDSGTRCCAWATVSNHALAGPVPSTPHPGAAARQRGFVLCSRVPLVEDAPSAHRRSRENRSNASSASSTPRPGRSSAVTCPAFIVCGSTSIPSQPGPP